MSSLAESLPDEIARVTEIKEMYISMRGRFQVNVEPAIFMMTQSINAAIKASIEGDVVAMIRAYEDLRGYAA